MIEQRSFSALVLASILTLAAPMLSHPSNLDMGAVDSELRASLDARTLPARAEAFLQDLTVLFEEEGYDLASVQLWAASGADDLGTGSVWAITPPPHAAHAQSSADS